MSRGAAKTIPPALCGHVTSAWTNNGTSASVTVSPYADVGVDGVTGAGDLLVLIHVVDSGAAGVGAPNTVGNAWAPVLKPDGNPVDETQTGVTGTVRLRMWWKTATAAEAAAPSTYTITNSFTARSGLGVRIVPWSAVGPGTLPLTAAVRTGASGRAYAPAVTLPDNTGMYRDVGLLGAVTAYPHHVGRGVFSNGTLGSSTFAPEQWEWTDVGFAGADTTGDRTVRVLSALGWDTLDGGPSQRHGDWGNVTNEARLNIPFVSATFLARPYQYPTATPGASWDDVAEDFDTAASLDDYDTTGTPTVTGGQLVLDGGDRVLRKDRVDFTRKALVVDTVGDYDATTTGNLQVLLTDGPVSGGGRVAITLTTVADPDGPLLNFTLYDEGFGATVDFVRLGPSTRWWRLREEAGILVVDYSADRVSWRTGTHVAHQLLADQLAALRVGIAVTGTPAARIEQVNPSPATGDPASLPLESTFTFMNASPAHRAAWHGRDVLMGIVDQGTTPALRTVQDITLKRRTYAFAPPAGGAEVYPGGTHGCLVTTCAVPPGGQFVEAVAFDGSDYTTIGALMSGVLWCARQGAKVINVSAGGGGDDPVIALVLGHISANYDCEVYFSAGNSYAYGIELPAAYCTVFSNVHSVAAWDEWTNTRPAFATHHEFVSGVAPGHYTGGRLPSGVAVTWSGSSASSPHAAQLCARLQTGRVFTAGQAGVALDRNQRPTGAPAADEGGGAYDLLRAIAVLGDPVGTSNVPAVAMPRFTHGQVDDVVAGFHQMARAVELQGSLCVVRYTPIDPASELPTIAALPTGFHGVVSWTHADTDSYDGMWSAGGAVLSAPDDGMYLALLHVRFGTTLIDGTVATGAPYNVGTRSAALLLNGSDFTANLVAIDSQPASTVGEGVTCIVAVILPLYRDDWLYADVHQTSGQTIQCLQNDWGSTWLGMARLSPLAPTLGA